MVESSGADLDAQHFGGKSPFGCGAE